MLAYTNNMPVCRHNVVQCNRPGCDISLQNWIAMIYGALWLTVTAVVAVE